MKMARCTLGRVYSLFLFCVALVLLVILASNFRHPVLTELLEKKSRDREHRYKPLLKELPVLNQSTVDQVRTFLFFVGYPRSGHSIVASCLDAHPEAIVAHEFNVFGKLLHPEAVRELSNRSVLYSALYQNSLHQSQAGWRSGQEQYRSKKGYTLEVNATGSWQGRFQRLTVIGDKSGGLTTHVYRDTPKLFVEALTTLQRTVGVPMKVLHVVRNPFDIVATKLLYRLSEMKGRRGNFSLGSPVTNTRHVMQAIKSLEAEAEAVSKVIGKLTVLTVQSEQFVLDTKATLKRICGFLNLECPDTYLQMCDSVVYDKPSRSRSVVMWNRATRDYVEELISRYPFFSQYSLDS